MRVRVLEPGFEKGNAVGELTAGSIKPGMWRQVKVDKVDCEAEIVQSELAVTYDAKMMKGITTPVWESWVIEDGSAWYVYH